MAPRPFLASTMLIDPRRQSYDMYFPTQAMGPESSRTMPERALDALAATAQPPKTIAVVANKFPSGYFVSVGAKEVMQKRGLRIVLDLEYELGARDFGAIAARVKAANADFLWIGGLGVDGVMLAEAMKKLDYVPKGMFVLLPEQLHLRRLMKVKQVQGGRWVTVWPKEWAAPGVKLIYPAP